MTRMPRDADSILGELRTLIEQAQTSPAPAPLTEPAALAKATADTDLPDLLALDDVLASRIVHRAAYDALKAMLNVLNGWIEGAQENCDALGHTSHGGDHGVCGKAFAPDDIRRMANDAARLVGTREPYTEVKP